MVIQWILDRMRQETVFIVVVVGDVVVIVVVIAVSFINILLSSLL